MPRRRTTRSTEKRRMIRAMEHQRDLGPIAPMMGRKARYRDGDGRAGGTPHHYINTETEDREVQEGQVPATDAELCELWVYMNAFLTDVYE